MIYHKEHRGSRLAHTSEAASVRKQKDRRSLWLALLIYALLAIAGFGLIRGQLARAADYTLPTVRGNTWQTGSDIWNSGALPVYAGVNCTTPVHNGTTNDGPAIQTCINSLSSNQAAVLTAGTFYVNSVITLKSLAVLRGQGSTTIIKLGSSGHLDTPNFSYSSISGYNGYSVFPSPYNLSGTPQKGDTQLTIGSGTVGIGTWIKVFGNDNPTLINVVGDDGRCDWCGDNSGYYLAQQIVQVTGIVSGSGGAGSVVNISRPLYLTPDVTARTINGHAESANAKYDIITWVTQKAGYENMTVTGASYDIGSNPIIELQGCLYCWVKGVETAVTGGSSNSAHIMLNFTYGAEIRDGYYHDMRSGASGAGYGIFVRFSNSDAKIENNVFRHNRHSLNFEGGGSGLAVLYNYIDDNYTDDTTYLGSARVSHGAHPFMNLLEGNVISHVTADDFWGSSSHTVFFRNWIWGDETENWSGAVAGTGTPNSGFDAVDLYLGQTYYSYVNNVLGRTGLHTTWSAATLSGYDPYASNGSPIVYSYGGALGSTASSSATILRQGNWDMKTNGIAYNDGGTGFTYATSLYYGSKPAFLGSCPFPAQGGDLAAKGSAYVPAYQRWLGTSCPGGPVTTSVFVGNGISLGSAIALQ